MLARCSRADQFALYVHFGCQSSASLTKGRCWQVVLDSFDTGELFNAHLLPVLHESFDQLPTAQHRLVFLDAALMLQGRPPAHLIALWEGVLLLQSNEDQDLLPRRSQKEAFGAWQSRSHRAAHRLATSFLNLLCDLDLVRVHRAAGYFAVSANR